MNFEIEILKWNFDIYFPCCEKSQERTRKLAYWSLQFKSGKQDLFL